MQTAKDGIATMTTTPDLFVRPFSQAVARGIPQVSVDTPPPAGSNVDTFVGNDNVAGRRGPGQRDPREDPGERDGRDRHRQPDPGAAGARPARAGHEAGPAAEAPEHQARRPAEHRARADARTTTLDGHRQGAPERGRLPRPGRPGRRVVRPHPAADRQDACSSAARDVDPVALQAVKDGHVYALGDPSTGSRATSRSPCSPAGRATARRCRRAGGTRAASLVTAKNIDEILARQRNSTTRTAWYKATVDKQLANPWAYLQPLPRREVTPAPCSRPRDREVLRRRPRARRRGPRGARRHGPRPARRERGGQVDARQGHRRRRAPRRRRRCASTAARCRSSSTADAARHGVAVVSQELSLFGDLDVLSNLFPMREPRRGPFIDRARDGRARAARPAPSSASTCRCAAGRRRCRSHSASSSRSPRRSSPSRAC